jgi:hypothetical protein
MSVGQPTRAGSLGLRAGELVEVRSEAEILATLDEQATLDGVPFMPEMLAYCGQRFHVFRRADKTCDAATTQPGAHIRRLHDTVHLEGLRCDGSAHGGCQANCLTFWKEAWLTRIDGPGAPDAGDGVEVGTVLAPVDTVLPIANVTRATLEDATRTDSGAPGETPVYSCQATEVGNLPPLPWWEPQQYVRDFRSGNIGVRVFLRGMLILLFNKFQAANNMFFPRFKLIRGGRRYPFFEGKLTGRTPKEELNLQPGEIVEIKSRQEIEATLNERGENRGLRFGITMVPYCGQRARVLTRVHKIIDEASGEMVTMKTPCIILENVTCRIDNFQFCPRAIYPYWREIWLRRVDDASAPADVATEVRSA